ncbi:twin-arginine translocation signal domain-containing protein [Rhodocytophaga rosea]|uniref:Twin-arginine translocation signal domain-containing protein n=1 Tax=Rhodocytophaga rosea TaxID=2704465 RepID=A0A6C0GE67_9BACT|nr:twin-arginine translocation signal domain-containing protein [Rhodocytophaga rosea]QHT66299.1 twin-arginine translocation signal domain-containing protein [Rhodocytophaga rosea]
MKTHKPSRRTFIKQSTVAAGSLLLTSQFGFNIMGKATNPDNEIIGHGEYRYKVNKQWGVLDPSKTPVFNCHEMVQDSKGRLIMINDEVKNNVLIYDKSGKLLDSWGTRYPGGHGLTLSAEGGEDFLFIADCGYFLGKDNKWQAQAGEIVKTTTDGKMVFALGHPSTIGIYKPEEKFQPTEIAVAPNGDFYVADGYGSDYIIQYNHQGKYIRHFGGHNNANPEHNLQNAHGVAVDLRNPAAPKLICTSRTENAFKFFTMDGKYIETVKLPGLFVCRPVMDGENLYAGVCWSTSRETGKRIDNSGFVTIMDKNNKVISNPGGSEPEYKKGELQTAFQEGNIFSHGHDVCVDNDKNLYVCQWNANKTYPVKLERV